MSDRGRNAPFVCEGVLSMWSEIVVGICIILGLALMVCDKIEKEKLYKKAIKEKFPSVEGYCVLFKSESCNWICLNNQLYIVVFSNSKPYSIVYCRELGEDAFMPILESRSKEKERKKAM